MTRVLRWCTRAGITAWLPPSTFVYGCRTAPDHLAADLHAGKLSSRLLTASVGGPAYRSPPEAMALSLSPEGTLEATKGLHK
jgi:hypothetical protein